MNTVINFSLDRRIKAKQDGGTIRKGIMLYQDFVEQHRDMFAAWLDPQEEYNCSGCHKMKPIADCNNRIWDSLGKSMVGVCTKCKLKMNKKGLKYVRDLGEI